MKKTKKCSPLYYKIVVKNPLKNYEKLHSKELYLSIQLISQFPQKLFWIFLQINWKLSENSLDPPQFYLNLMKQHSANYPYHVEFLEIFLNSIWFSSSQSNLLFRLLFCFLFLKRDVLQSFFFETCFRFLFLCFHPIQPGSKNSKAILIVVELEIWSSNIKNNVLSSSYTPLSRFKTG